MALLPNDHNIILTKKKTPQYYAKKTSLIKKNHNYILRLKMKIVFREEKLASLNL